MKFFDRLASDIEDDVVLLRKIKQSDTAELFTLAKDPDIWAHFTEELLTLGAVQAFVDTACAALDAEVRVPYAIVEKTTGRIAGTTSCGNISERDLRVEIGWTWLGTEKMGSGINTRVKRLLLEHLFEDLRIQRVEFKTDVLNVRARKALKKIGATEEGILRSHTLMPHNRRRDTVYYSILADEWPAAKARLAVAAGFEPRRRQTQQLAVTPMGEHTT